MELSDEKIAVLENNSRDQDLAHLQFSVLYKIIYIGFEIEAIHA